MKQAHNGEVLGVPCREGLAALSRLHLKHEIARLHVHVFLSHLARFLIFKSV